jgi:large subunit ribosomal protein L17
MKKRKKGRKFHREAGQRKALIQGLARALVLKERITITDAKAKDLSSYIEKKISKAKKGDLSARRELRKTFSNTVVKKLISEIAPRYKERTGGYTRILKLGPRKSDGAKMAIIEFVK